MSSVLPFLRRSCPAPDTPPTFANTRAFIEARRPALPTYTLNTDHIAHTASQFMTQFPGTTLFAVKTNPHPAVIESLYRAGMRAFDVASMPEIQLVRDIAPDAELFFMHTIKSPENIRDAYFEYGVRNFSLDHEDELTKIIESTEGATDLNLFVRVALPKNENASIDFSAKFGAHPETAPALLLMARRYAQRLGICFHVGTQTRDAASYGNAVNRIKSVIRESGVHIDMLDIGGGFPVPYEGEDVPSVESCLSVINTALRHAELDHLTLFAEPGRCLVAQGGSLVVRVELRKDDCLYINDGTYGGLFDAGPLLKTPFPVRAVRAAQATEAPALSGNLQAFRLAGPTCDGLDMMDGPFYLPENIKTGDWIEIQNTGAYSQSLRTNFNGFGHHDTVFVRSN